MDRLGAMSAFAAVAEQRGFALAARRLGISPSAVTRAVAALEEGLGVRLLQRTTRSVSLTDAGTRYLEAARRILGAIEDAEAAARLERATPRGRLAVAAPEFFGRREVAPLLADFLARFPEVTAELQLADRLVNLVEEGVDLAVRIGQLADSSLRARVVGRTRRVLVASPRYLEQRGRPRAPADLARHRLLRFSGLAPLPEWRFCAGGAEQRIAIAPAFTSNSAEAVIAHALRGAGLALVLSYQVREPLRRGALRVLLPGHEPPPLPIQLVWPGGRLLPAGVRAFVELAAGRDWDFSDG